PSFAWNPSNREGFKGRMSSIGLAKEDSLSTRFQAMDGRPFYGDHDVTAASRPVKAFVPVRIRLVTPIFQVQSAKCRVQNSALYILHSTFIRRAVEFGLS